MISTSDKVEEVQVEQVEKVAKKAKVEDRVAKKAKVESVVEEDQEESYPFLLEQIKDSPPEKRNEIWSEIFDKTGFFYKSSQTEELDEVSRTLDEIPGDELFPDQLGIILYWLSKAVKDGTVTLPQELQEEIIASYDGKH
jgi:hypothetical protein